MWIFTRYGFFSAVCAREGDGAHGRPIDPDRIMVRARLRDHLERLIAAFPDLVGGATIIETPTVDYPCRIIVPKSTWSAVLSRLGDETDADNFKSSASRHQGAAGQSYLKALHDVWSIMRRMEIDRR
ncbi:MAG: hypothetical protein SFX72_02940 [Isosphaeraceae bacterium]|nr:hypothetical protein [Isosphaeraceae bacterium]